MELAAALESEAEVAVAAAVEVEVVEAELAWAACSDMVLAPLKSRPERADK